MAVLRAPDSYCNLEELASWIRTAWLRYIESVPMDRRAAFVGALVDDGYLAQYPLGLDGTVEGPMVRFQAVVERP